MTINIERCTVNDLCNAKPGHFGNCRVSPHANAVLANARRVSQDNAEIGVKVLGMLDECQQALADLVEAVKHVDINYVGNMPIYEHPVYGPLVKAISGADRVIDKQKAEKIV